MAWIEPLELQTWFMNVFAGTPDIFLAIALFAISGLAAFFRMPILALFFMIGIFLLLFSSFITSPIIILIAIIGGLLIGFVLAKIFSQ